MKLHMNNKLVQKLIAVNIDKVVYTSLKWRDVKKTKFLHELKQRGYYKQISRFGFKRIKQ